jgi:hypothetical protein
VTLTVMASLHAGGTLTDERGMAVKRWLWDSRRQQGGTPPASPVTFPLNDYMTFEYVDRCERSRSASTPR